MTRPGSLCPHQSRVQTSTATGRHSMAVGRFGVKKTQKRIGCAQAQPSPGEKPEGGAGLQPHQCGAARPPSTSRWGTAGPWPRLSSTRFCPGTSELLTQRRTDTCAQRGAAGPTSVRARARCRANRLGARTRVSQRRNHRKEAAVRPGPRWRTVRAARPRGAGSSLHGRRGAKAGAAGDNGRLG